MNNCCCKNCNTVCKWEREASYLKQTNDVWVRRGERDFVMMQELYNMLPEATRKELDRTNWFHMKIKEWDCDRSGRY